MTDSDIEKIYKGCIDQSHTAALRAIFDAGYSEGAGQTIGGGDPAGSATVVTDSQIESLDIVVSSGVTS